MGGRCELCYYRHRATVPEAVAASQVRQHYRAARFTRPTRTGVLTGDVLAEVYPYDKTGDTPATWRTLPAGLAVFVVDDKEGGFVIELDCYGRCIVGKPAVRVMK